MKSPAPKVGNCIRISYRKKRIWVRIIIAISGHDLVAIDREGRVYTTWWDLNLDQSGKRPRICQRHWRRFNAGLYYLRRSLLYALVSAEQIRIPTLQNLQEFCQNRQAEIRLFEGNVAKQLCALTPKFAELADFLTGKQRWTLTESKQQLSFFLLLRDSLGRLNIGVLSARLSAIDLRFTKELEHLLGWLPHYAARLTAVRGIQNQLQTFTQRIQNSLAAMIHHEAFGTGKTSAKQTWGIEQSLLRQIVLLTEMQPIQPFTKWAKLCQKDLQQAANFVRTGKFSQASEIIKRVLEAGKLRLLAFELEELICQIGLDLVLNTIDKNSSAKTILDLLAKARQIDESGFLEPVCKGTVLPNLVKVKTAADHNDWPMAKAALKTAIAAI